ncbi:hypothetical protein CICLE_v10007183mg [Citrus x clementina]|uniref:Pectinesterase inhibitor domain-containing protein n=1 Tax=Citrus clementina TaxID=85681 RepID=V4U082_CITCL|nr:hypothetical protein CICLE_v10007183mg [Citrus x clementina]
MEPNNNQMLLLFSFFTFIILAPATCLIAPAPNSANMQPVSHPGSQPTPSLTANAAPTPEPTSAWIQSMHGNHLYQTVHPYHVPSVARNPEIKKICDSTDYPSLCLTFFAPFCKHKSDPLSMLEMAIRATSSQIRLTIAAADKLVHAHAINLPAAVSRLGHCKDSYRDALDNLQNAMDAIPDRDFGTINSMLRAAVTDFSDCDDAFVGMAQYSNYDGHLTKMVINCVAIASLVK